MFSDTSSTLITLATAGALAFLVWRFTQPAPRVPEAPPMTETPKVDPLASLRELLKTTAPAGGEGVPDAVRAALMEIVAEALRGGVLKQDWNIPNVTYEGYPVGSYRVTIEKTA